MEWGVLGEWCVARLSVRDGCMRVMFCMCAGASAAAVSVCVCDDLVVATI